MQFINKILRGMVIGIANIIPGVSGGTMMVSMGIYDTLIHSITHLFSDFKKSVKTLLPYAIGMLVGIFALASLLKFLFDHYALPTTTCFIGLILGGLPILFRKVSRKDIHGIGVLLFVVFFAGIIALAFVGRSLDAQEAARAAEAATQAVASAPELMAATAGNMGILLVMGVVAAATMVIPGVSGSMMLMLLGYYYPVLNAVSALKDAALALNFSAMAQPLLLLLPFGLGVLIGIFAVAKLIEFLLERFPTPTYCAVLGLVIASPVAILMKTNMAGVTWITILVSLVTFAAGFALSAWLAKGGAAAPAQAGEEPSLPTEDKE